MIISYPEFLDRRIQRQVQTHARRSVGRQAPIDLPPLAAVVEMTSPEISQPDVVQAVSGRTGNV